MKNNIGFILIKPQLGENIGACARAIKNFGFSNLNITSPRDGWPNVKAKATSVGAYDILNKIKIYKTTEKSIRKFDVIFSFSARKRHINKKHINLKEFLSRVKKFEGKKIGLMFGPEASGLSNFDLSYSNYTVQIPTARKFKSINLSHSVFLVSYELFKMNIKNSRLTQKTPFKGSLLQIMNLLKFNLEKRNFFKPKEKKNAMITNINNLFYRL